jgi:hypothetical protein
VAKVSQAPSTPGVESTYVFENFKIRKCQEARGEPAYKGTIHVEQAKKYESSLLRWYEIVCNYIASNVSCGVDMILGMVKDGPATGFVQIGRLPPRKKD